MEKSNSGGGITLFGALFLVFLILKLTHVVNWSWWLVTLPLWGVALLVIIFFAIFFLVTKMRR